MHAGVFTLFATHFSALRQLEVLYPNVKLCQFAVNAGEGSFQCTWQLKAGAVDVPHYGLMLASDAGFPEQVTCKAIAIKQTQEAELQPPAGVVEIGGLLGSNIGLTIMLGFSDDHREMSYLPLEYSIVMHDRVKSSSFLTDQEMHARSSLAAAHSADTSPSFGQLWYLPLPMRNTLIMYSGNGMIL